MRLVLVSLAAFVISACSTPQLPVTEESYELAAKLQQHNKQLTAWDMVANSSLSTEFETYSLNVSWQQDKERYKLRFDAPFTTGVLRLKGHSGFAELVLENKKVIQGENPEQLISEVTPFNIPVKGLTHWIRGIPHQQADYEIKIKSNGHTDSILQDGWVIQYDDWGKVTIGSNVYELPDKIELTQKKLNIKISPSSWTQKQIEKNPLFSDLDF